MSDGPCSGSWTAPGAGITDACIRNSDVLHIVVVFLTGLAMYNGCELAIIIFLTFKRYEGLYFWSLVTSNFGVIFYAVGFLLMFLDITTGNMRFLAVALNTIGWWPMITGQSLVLWSRLHLILYGEQGDRILKYTKWMIIINAIVLQTPTTVLSFGTNGHLSRAAFIAGYNVMEKIQMAGFFCQELILSTIYILQTRKILHGSLHGNTRRTMLQLILVNVLIIIMDLGLLGLEAASLYILETLVKGVVYSIKLKLEFAILGMIVDISGGSEASRARADFEVDFIQLDTKSTTDKGGTQVSAPANVSSGRPSTFHRPEPPQRCSPGRETAQHKMTGDETQFAQAQYIEDVAESRGAASTLLEFQSTGVKL